MIKKLLCLLFNLLILKGMLAQSPVKADSVLANVFLEKAIEFDMRQEFDSMYFYATKGYEIFGRLQFSEQQAECANLIYVYEINLGELDKALQYAKITVALRSFSLGTNHEETLRARKDVSIILFVQGETDSAMQMLEECIIVGEQLKDINPKIMGKIYSTTASFYENMGNLKMALNAGEKFHSYVKKNAPEDSTLWALALGALGKIYLNIDQTDAAIKSLVKAVNYANPDTNLNVAISNYGFLARAYYTIGNLPDAIRFEEKSRDLIRKNYGTQNPDYAYNIQSLGAM